jgi:hypothetical protein
MTIIALFSPQIIIKTEKGTRIAYPKQQMHIKLCSVIAHSHGPRRLAKTVFEDAGCRPIIEDMVMKKLNEVCTKLCSKKFSSVLRKKDADSLMIVNLQLGELLEEWKREAPLFCRMLEVMCVNNFTSKHYDINQHLSQITYIGSMCLYHRNPEMNRLQTAVGLTLEDGSAVDEALAICHGYGITVAPSTVYSRRKKLTSRNESMKETLVTIPKREVEVKDNAIALKDSLCEEVVFSALQPVPSPAANCTHTSVQTEVKSSLNFMPHCGMYDVPLEQSNVFSPPPVGRPLSNTSECAQQPHYSSNMSSPCCLTESRNYKSTEQGPYLPNIELKSMEYTLPALSVYPNQSHCEKSTAVPRPANTAMYIKHEVARTCKTKPVQYEAIGDNFDLTVSPNAMTKRILALVSASCHDETCIGGTSPR